MLIGINKNHYLYNAVFVDNVQSQAIICIQNRKVGIINDNIDTENDVSDETVRPNDVIDRAKN